MKASDIMTRRIISVAPETTVLEAIGAMLQNHISGLPVIDAAGNLVGVVTEGDFLRRAEIGTQRQRSRWLELLTGPRTLAEEYVHAHGRKVEDVMTSDPVTVSEDTPLEDVVSAMERRRIKRLPVMRGRAVVGIVSRANLMHALASLGRAAPAVPNSDTEIRNQILAELDKQVWAPVALVDVVVRDGVVALWGTITEEKHGEGLKVVAENIPGVNKVVNHLTWIEPVSGMILSSPDEDARGVGTKH
jgi:CBS domain-containing protein